MTNPKQASNSPLVQWMLKRAKELEMNEDAFDTRKTPERPVDQPDVLPTDPESAQRDHEAVMKELFAHAADGRKKYDAKERNSAP